MDEKTRERYFRISMALSTDALSQLGISHLKWLLETQPDPVAFCEMKLERPGYTTVPEAYEELLGVLRKEKR